MKTHSNILVVLVHIQLKSFYIYHLSTRDVTQKMYQALSQFSVLQATGSWMSAWERGYISSLRDNVSLCEDLFPRTRYEAIFCYVLTLFLSTELSLCRCTGLLLYLMNKLAHTGFASHASKVFYVPPVF